MVFTGKPSTGCGTCKKRRIKCDEARPRCGQCIKSKRDCSGYTNRVDLMFRDETKSTEQRIINTPSRAEAANAQKSRRPTKLTVSTVQGQRARRATSSARDDDSVPQSPSTDLVEQATLHFLANFVTTSHEEDLRGPYSYLAPILHSSHRPYFTVAFEAVALASLSSVVGGVDKQALSKYTTALSLMASAIQDPAACQRDDLLAASLLLGLYETISSVQFGSMAWGSHLQGTVTLCGMRSRDMLNTKQGRDLMAFIKEQYLSHFFTNGTIDPAGIAFWMDDTLIDDVTSKLQNLAFQLGLARAEANKFLQASPFEKRNIDAMTALIEKYKFLDRQFRHWSKSLPDSFKHKSVQWDFPVLNNDYASAEVFPGKIHIFPSIVAASLWCRIQNYRTFACSLIMFTTAWTYSYTNYENDPDYLLYFEESKGIVRELVALVPFHLKWIEQHTEPPPARALDGYVCGNDNASKSLGGVYALWPLTSILTNDSTTPEQREWAKGRFEYISKVLGIRTARSLSQMQVRVPSSVIQYHSMAMHKRQQNMSYFEEALVSR